MTTEQLPLPLAPLVETPGATRLTIQERFERFHADNPWVLRALEALTAERVSRGRTRVGMKALIERLRDDYETATTGKPWKFDNTLTSRYVRALIAEHPEWDGLFETRELRKP